MRKWISWGLVVLSSALLAACGPVKLPPVSTYTMMSTHPFHVPRRAQTDQTLYVEVPIASPGYETTDMIYVETPFKLSAFTQNRWVAPPGLMLQTIVAQAIRSRGYFKAVLTTPVAMKLGCRLEMQLIQLQQEFMTGVSRVRLVVQATLIDNNSGKALGSQRFEEVVLTGAPTPYAGVIATNHAATSLAEEVARFVTRYANQN